MLHDALSNATQSLPRPCKWRGLELIPHGYRCTNRPGISIPRVVISFLLTVNEAKNLVRLGGVISSF